MLCYGDSNTYGYDPRSFFGGRYSAQIRWTELLAQMSGWDVGNAGENGREIPRYEYEFQRVGQMIEEWSADKLVIMLGSNDLLQGGTPSAVARRMEQFLSRIPLTGTQILLIAPPPMTMGDWVPEPRLIEDSKLLAGAYEELAHKLGICYADAGDWGIALAFDGVHFTEAGHRAFADGIYKALNR